MGASGFPGWRGQSVGGRLAKKSHYRLVVLGPESGDVLTILYAPFSWNTAAVEENDTGQASPLMLPRACAEPEFLRPRYTPDQGSPAIHDEQMSRNSYHGRSEFSVKCHAWARCTRNSA